MHSVPPETTVTVPIHGLTTCFVRTPADEQVYDKSGPPDETLKGPELMTIPPQSGLPQGLFVTKYASSTCTGTPTGGNFFATGGTNGCQTDGQFSWKATCAGISVFTTNTNCGGTASFSGPSTGCVADPSGVTGFVSVQTIGCPAQSGYVTAYDYSPSAKRLPGT